MIHSRIALSLMIVGALALCSTASVLAATPDQVLAFPGAEGFGRFAQGGRGGDVYHVVSLDDSGPGSLREGIQSAQGPRTIVFDVSGTIELKKPLRIEKSFLTIAGQTAPGDGICLKDHTFQIRKASHLIVRYLRIRLGDKNKKRPAGQDAMTTNDLDHVIFDHISTTWGIDANHDLRRGGNFTLQWSIYAEALHNSLHEKGPHAMLGSFRDLTDSITVHHNLLASSRERHPTLGGSPRTKREAIIDFRNNVVYNLEGATNLGNCRINVINNYYRPGPNTSAKNVPFATKFENEGAIKVFMSGNVIEGNERLTRDNFAAVSFDRWVNGSYKRTSLADIKVDKEFDVGAARPVTQPAAEAYDLVLRFAGASLHRDQADSRLVAGVKDRSHRRIDSQDQVGGWPTLTSRPAPRDSDGDGIPDDWERAHGLNAADPKDGNLRDQGGYTNLEIYLNSLCPPMPGAK